MQPSEQQQGLERRLAQQLLVTEFGQFALRTHDLDAILHEACRIGADGLGAALAKVLERRPGGDFLLCAGIGWRPGVVGRALVEGDARSPAGYAYLTERAVISNDLATEHRFKVPELLVEHEARSAVNVIIRGEGAAFGVLEVDGRRSGPFSPHDVIFLQALANTLGAAIDKERVREAAESLNAALKQALADKDLLAREVDHRIKNSLTVIGSLLTLQEHGAKAPEAKAALKEAAARVLTVARIHEQLYHSPDVTSVAFAPYLERLCADLASSLGRGDGVSFEVEASDITLPAARALPLGLIAVELVTNAIKHARHASGRSTVWVNLEPEDEGLRLAVADNGPGLPDGFSTETNDGLGMRLVRLLVRQVGGTFAADNWRGRARFVVRAPLDA